MAEGKVGKNILITAAAILAVAVLTVCSILWVNKAGQAEKAARESEAASAAYAAALAESSAREAEAYEAADMAERAAAEIAAAEKETVGDSHGGEAALYSEFISGDGEIRRALSTLTRDEPDLVKNYRLKIDLKKMESVELPSGKGLRVRFSGRFDNPSKRDSAVIRINAREGSYEGRIYLADLRFDDDKKVDLSALSDEDLSDGHGGALRSIGLSSLKGEGCVVCDTLFDGKNDGDKVSIVVPLKGLDSSGFQTVYYDLYFEGEDPSFIFTTGCDFAGREETDPALDRINEAFALYRSKAAAGQETAEAEANVLSAIEDMKKELSRFPGTDPLVIRINEGLDRKAALITGENADTGEVTDNGESPEAGDSGAESTAAGDSGGGAKKAEKNESVPVTPAAGYASSGEEKGNGGALAAMILLSLLALVMIILLSVTGFSAIKKERDLETVRRVREDKDRLREEENRGLRKDLVRIENKKEEIRKRIVNAGNAASGPDTAALRSLTDRIESEIERAERLISEALKENGGRDSGGTGETASLREAGLVLKDLCRSGESLNDNIESIRAQLEETSGSVKDINMAATIISDVASETNLLSLNASIEAARAGESGRGFAVVAGEISRLAEQTERSVQEISDTVDKLNADFDKTNRLMQGLDSFAAGQKESLSVTRQKFGEAEEELKSRGENRDESREILNECRSELRALKELSAELQNELMELESAGARDESSALLQEISEELKSL